VFDYKKHLDWLVSHHHNFFRLWAWEQSRWATDTPDDHYWFYPGPPYLRAGPGNALDGNPKFDLTQLDPTFFNRLRDRVIEAGQRGIYVSIMLFNGWSIEVKGGVAANNPWKGHPFNLLNNINEINGDANNDGSGSEVHTLNIPAVTALQEAYVQHVIDAVNDLDNVLYEISNESRDDSQEWQYHMLQFIKNYESTKPKQHPVGMTVEWPNGNNYELFNSSADWISPNIDYSSIAVDGRKVVISDTDHICGVCRDGTWVWRTFMMGGNPIFMDVYDGTGYGTGAGDANFETDRPGFVSARRSMGQTLDYAKRINLAHMIPHPDITSTGYALAYPGPKGAEFLVYRLSGSTPITVDLSATEESLSSEWFNPVDGAISSGDFVKGGAQRSFMPPFTGEVVLYLKGGGSSENIRE